jgi:hypothetical protein
MLAVSTQIIVAASAAQVPSNAIQSQVTFTALSGNTGITYIGTTSSVSSSNGYPLEKGTSVTFQVVGNKANTNQFWTVGTASDKVGIAGS